MSAANPLWSPLNKQAQQLTRSNLCLCAHRPTKGSSRAVKPDRRHPRLAPNGSEGVSLKNTYRTSEEVDRDKAQLVELFDALNASPSSLRRDECGLWILRGRPGCFASTWGDGSTWQLVVTPEQEISKQAWTWIKKRLAFAEVNQDGDAEGCFRLHRLPTPEEAEEIRAIVGIRKRMDLSPEVLANITARLPKRPTG